MVAPEDKGTGTRPLVTQLVLVSDPEASVLLLNGASCPHTPAPGGVCPQGWPPPRLPVMVNLSPQMASVWMKEPLSSSVPAGRLPSPPALPVSPNSWHSVGSEASLFICLGGLPAHFSISLSSLSAAGIAVNSGRYSIFGGNERYPHPNTLPGPTLSKMYIFLAALADFHCVI